MACNAVNGESYLSKSLQFIKMMIKAIASKHFERAIFFYYLSDTMASIMRVDLAQVRVCTLEIGGNETYCQGPGRSSTAVQNVMASISIWEGAVTFSIPMITLFFLGAWSDIYGRKLAVLTPILGGTIRYVALLICLFYTNTSAATIVLASVLPVAITGGLAAGTMAGFTYLADTTTSENRTFRTGIFIAAGIIGSGLGYALSGAIKSSFGSSYALAFTLGLIFDTIAFASVFFFVENTGSQLVASKSGYKKILKDVFDIRNIANSIKTFFRQREGGLRTRLLSVILVLLCIQACDNGEYGLRQHFATSKQVGWNTQEYSYFGTYRTIVDSLGTLFTIVVLLKILNLGDATLGILASISAIGAALMYAFANGNAMMYSASVVGTLSNSRMVAFRSILSKIVPSDELGKIYTILTICESCAALAIAPVYAAVYKATVDKFPGAFFFLTIAFAMPILVISCWFRCRPDAGRENQAANKIQVYEDEGTGLLKERSDSKGGYQTKTYG